MAKFVKSATCPEEFPKSEKPEVVFLGRSNAGKSTLLNALMGQKLAYVGGRPGMTTLVNFFALPDKIYDLVDLPGYGYSRRSGEEQVTWQAMVEDYLTERANLATAVLVMDCRRDWSQDEEDLVDWLQSQRELKIVLALTKADKLNQKQFNERQKHFKGQNLGIEWLFVSGAKKTGLKELERTFDLS